MHKESLHVPSQCSVGIVRGVWHGPAHLKNLDYLENYYKKTAEKCFMIPSASSRQWSKLILGILSIMPYRPKGRDRAAPIFCLVELFSN